MHKYSDILLYGDINNDIQNGQSSIERHINSHLCNYVLWK